MMNNIPIFIIFFQPCHERTATLKLRQHGSMSSPSNIRCLLQDLAVDCADARRM
jgi:hypothetical protein